MHLKRLSTHNHMCSMKHPSMFEFTVNRMVRGYHVLLYQQLRVDNSRMRLSSKRLQNVLRVGKTLVGKTLANDSQFAKFANIFPHLIIVLYGILQKAVLQAYSVVLK